MLNLIQNGCRFITHSPTISRSWKSTGPKQSWMLVHFEHYEVDPLVLGVLLGPFEVYWEVLKV